MKKLLAIAFTAGLLFTSCSNDDDEQNNEFSIVGIWQPSREIVVSGSNGVTLSNTSYSGCYSTSTFDFKSNNTLVSNIFELNTSNNCVSTGIETVPYTYDHAAKKLVIDGENIEIVSRTVNEIQIVSEYDDRDSDGIDDKIIFVLAR
ncbi:lipocalin family protein [Chryseobacterium zhengzhouense]|uniref:Lipocalin family protein n=1 Tax=Chryseobacterium zhengzhouense TaxID=1636086 RepID=A0ABW2LVI5_9FLAO